MRFPPRLAHLVLGAFLLSGLTLYLAHPIWLAAIGHVLIVEDQIRPADAIVVIGRDKTGERVERGVELLKQGLGKYFIISGRDIAWETNEADIMKSHAIALGVPEGVILLDTEGTTPSVQAGHIRSLMAGKGLYRILLVTESYHSARAREAFRAAMGEANIEVMSATVPAKFFEPDSWWKSRRGAKTVFREYWQWAWDQEED